MNRKLYRIDVVDDKGFSRMFPFDTREEAFDAFRSIMTRSAYVYFLYYGAELLAVYSDNYETMSEELRRMYG